MVPELLTVPVSLPEGRLTCRSAMVPAPTVMSAAIVGETFGDLWYPALVSLSSEFTVPLGQSEK
jgi:hypothetical protein